MIKIENLRLVTEWDKTFPKSDLVNHEKVIFPNRYGITLAADLYTPESAEGKLPAIAVCGPFGAVKEQCSGLYAQTLAERGFVTLAFDPSFTGESGGQPRYMASPDINTEDFMAAVDFLSLHGQVDAERIGILGICGWGGMALNAAALDTRVKATVASTMYDMTRVNAKGYFDAEDSEEARYVKREAMCAQRLVDLQVGEYALGGGQVVGIVDFVPAALQGTGVEGVLGEDAVQRHLAPQVFLAPFDVFGAFVEEGAPGLLREAVDVDGRAQRRPWRCGSVARPSPPPSWTPADRSRCR